LLQLIPFSGGNQFIKDHVFTVQLIIIIIIIIIGSAALGGPWPSIEVS
jgi:hypothetical protein